MICKQTTSLHHNKPGVVPASHGLMLLNPKSSSVMAKYDVKKCLFCPGQTSPPDNGLATTHASASPSQTIYIHTPKPQVSPYLCPKDLVSCVKEVINCKRSSSKPGAVTLTSRGTYRVCSSRLANPQRTSVARCRLTAQVQSRPKRTRHAHQVGSITAAVRRTRPQRSGMPVCMAQKSHVQ